MNSYAAAGVALTQQNTNRQPATPWQDLDCEPRLASIASGSVDAVLCCNSVYYLTRIEEVAAEVGGREQAC